MRLLNWC